MTFPLKTDTYDVLVSSITVRNNLHRKKVAEANIVLKESCKVNNEKKINHFNGSKLHLNRKGTSILSNTFVESLSNAL